MIRPLAGLALAALVTCFAARATAEERDEYSVKAAFLVNFLKFVDWPRPEAGSASPIVVGVIEPDPFGKVLDRLAAGARANGRAVVVRRFASLADASGCHVLFIGRAAWEGGDSLPARASGVLTVGESEDFLASGGAVRFVLAEGRVRFVIAADAPARTGLKLDAHLLRLGASTRGDAP